MERQQPQQAPLWNVQQQLTSSLSEVETDSRSDAVDRVVGSSSSSLKWQNPVQKHYGPQNKDESGRVERDDCVSGEKLVFLKKISTRVNNLDWSWLVALLVHASFSFPKTAHAC